MVTTRDDIRDTQDEHGEHFHGVREMIHTLGKVISLQFRIVTLRVRAAVADFCLALIFMTAALAFVTVGVIFLDIGLFELLAWGVGSVWASLIFAGIHLVAALLMFLAGKKYFRKVFSDVKRNEISHGGSDAKQ